MTRIATPENEAALSNVAEHGTTAHMDKLVRKYCWAERLEAKRASDRHFHRYLRFAYDDDDSPLIYVRLPPEVGTLVRKAIEAAVEAQSNVSAETSKRCSRTTAHSAYVS
ncbi:MAG TPA: hypothetical protein VIM81_01980 [Gammaproteobacteria bacterium]